MQTMNPPILYYKKKTKCNFKIILISLKFQIALLVAARKRAIRRKFAKYSADSNYRKSYRNRVYYNVNQDIPIDDNLHMKTTITTTPNENVSPHQANENQENSHLIDWDKIRAKVLNESF